jgi:large subunit ribosomal protein L19
MGALFSSSSAVTVGPPSLDSDTDSSGAGVDRADMPYLHHGKRPRYRDYVKFRSPRKRASKLLHELTSQGVQAKKEANPKIWESNFKVGDALELAWVPDGGKAKNPDKIRGVVIGITRRGLDSSVLLRDVVYGQPVERRMPLFSPLLKSIKVLEENFVYKGKRKVKRAKLYFLRDRNPLCKCSGCSRAP